MQRTMPSRRIYDIQKDQFVIRNIVELQSGHQIRKVCVGDYKYACEDILGSGFSSTVYKATLRTNNKQKYAIKVIDLKKFKQDSSLELLDMEVDIAMSLAHPNIIQCMDVFKTKSYYYLIFEYCPHGDLEELIKFQKFMAEDRAIQIMKQVIDGYKHIMSKGIIHRDLKPANIMRFGNKWKIGDFGFARYCKDQYVLDKIHVGTPLYSSPESLGLSKYSFRGDLFALGVILYEMLVGTTPWPCKNQKDLLKQMKDCESPPVPDGIISEQIKEFLKRTLEMDFYNRMSKDQFKKFTFDNVDMDNLIKQRPPKGVSPIVRSPSKSNGKGFFLTPIKVQKNQQIKSNEKLRVPPNQLQLNSQKKSNNKILPPNKIQLIVPADKSSQNNDYIQKKEEQSTVKKSTQSQKQYEEGNSPLFSETYKVNAKITYNQIQFLRIIKDLIRNIHFLNLDRRQRSFLVSLLYRYCIINLKMLTSNRQNILRLDRWDTYKKTERFDKVVREVEENVEKYEKWLNEYQSGQIVQVEILENFPLSNNSNSLTSSNPDSLKLFIDHKFYAVMFNILRKFTQQNIEKQLVNLVEEEEKKTFYATVSQFYEIIKIVKARTDYKLHQEGIGLKQKMTSVFDNNMESINDFNEEMLPLKVAELLQLCKEDVIITNVQISPLRKGKRQI